MAVIGYSSHVSVPNSTAEPISDENLIKDFLLDLRASVRVPRTAEIYGDSIRRLSKFAQEIGFPPLATMEREHVRHWLFSLFEAGNKPGGVHVRYRGVNRFFRWWVAE